MDSKRNPKKDKQIDAARRIAAKSALDPRLLFSRASQDDLANYTPEMLALSAEQARKALAGWEHNKARVLIEAIEGVEPAGIAVSLLTIVDHNQPFLYDSIMGEVTSTYRDLTLAVHPILHVEGGKEPFLHPREAPADPEHTVSLIQIHIPLLTAEQTADLEQRIDKVLSQVHLAIGDWQPMLARFDTAINELSAFSRKKTERDEALAFVEWLRDDNFTFLGMREYTYSGNGSEARFERASERGLGILSDPDVLVLRQGKNAVMTTPEILEFLEGPDFLIVTKANVKSIIHRRAYMDYIGIKRFDEAGKVIGELRIVGLFTATAYTHSVSDIPLLRAKIARIKDHFGFDKLSHSGRMLKNTLESYPRDDLFQIHTDMLIKFCEQIMELAERPRIRALARIDQFDRFVSVIIYVPRENYNSYVREKVGEYLATIYEGHVSAYYPAFPEGGIARVHIIIGRTGGKTPRIPQPKLELAIRDIATPWGERFSTLAGPHQPILHTTQAYQEAFTPEEAFADLEDIVACSSGEPIRIGFYRSEDEGRAALSLRIFHQAGQLSLSRRVPLLENLGFQVLSEQTYEIEVGPQDSRSLVVLHDMELEIDTGRPIDFTRQAPQLEEAFLDAFLGLIDNDSFNRLVLLCGASAREVSVLRAYARYLRQTGIVYSQNHIADTLARYPQIAVDLLKLFHDGFDPALSDKKRHRRLGERHADIETALGDVPNLDDDRTLRRYVNVIDATLRTNYFQRGEDGKPHPMLAFKLDPKLLDQLPEPRPFREMFVYGTEVEGVHLRFGKVARGGLRWSDRGEDYRTEVLGLVKAQQVKNAVIVPVGAKGGFFPKKLPAGGSRDEIFNAGREAYKTYIRTLLSITDNIIDGDVVPPGDTLRVDDDDPYFVVAADKGTATFSDTANGLAQDAGFWLDDAFASGGSAGYDHKKMGITARGAWEAVKRHFREQDIDIQTTPFTVAGVGDMSGDVFGNGMLLSREIRLIAAFDHRDIIIDPTPDTTATFAERERLFALPRSSWQDYDRSVLSKGGMIISRAEKSVKLTPEAAAAIDLGKTTATPFEILTAILKSPVDLLWFGGIGTYIKATSETDADVGDRANDAIRVTAGEVRAKVIGEGANLGVTQKGRIAYALAGGRCNSDAIDNSAGVNSSDVEVNIKVALSPAMKDGRLPREKRNKLLTSMTEEVAALVLRNNYLQSLAISLSERKGVRDRENLSRMMAVLESRGQLNRKVETLPDDATMAERYIAGKPLTRPEIGVLLSYAKIVLFDDILESTLPDDPHMSTTLTDYFPAGMKKAYATDIAQHRLHREIIATVLANEVINRGGPGFVQQMADITSCAPADIVKAAFLAIESFDLPDVWREIDALDGALPGAVQNMLYARVEDIFADATRLILQTKTGDGTLESAGRRLGKAIKGMRTSVKELPADIELEAAGIPETLSEKLRLLPTLVLAPEIMVVAERTSESLPRATEAYFAVTEIFRIARLLEAGERVPTSDHYDSLALTRSLQQITAARRDIVIAALAAHPRDKKPVEAWYAGDRLRVNRISGELISLSDAADLTLSKVTVAAGLLGDLVQRTAQKRSA